MKMDKIYTEENSPDSYSTDKDIVGDPIPGSVDPDTGDKDQRNRDSQQPEPKAQEIG